MRKYPMRPRKPYRARDRNTRNHPKLKGLRAPTAILAGIGLGMAVGLILLVFYRYHADIGTFAARVTDCHTRLKVNIRTAVRLSRCLDED